MIFRVLYAFSSVSVHWNGVRCTAACNGVAKSARCRNMRLCQRSCPRNLPNCFAFFRAGDLMIASIFQGSTAMPSLLTICPSNVPLVMPNAHLAGFELSRAVRHRSRQRRKWCKCELCIPYTAKSSKNTCINAGMYSPNTSEMIRGNVVGAVFKPNIITSTTKTPHSVTKAVFSWSLGCIRTWL